MLKKTEGALREICGGCGPDRGRTPHTGVSSYDISLEKQEVLVKGTIPYDDLKAKIAKTGKEVRSRARAECHLGLGGSSDGPDHLWRNGCVKAQQQT